MKIKRLPIVIAACSLAFAVGMLVRSESGADRETAPKTSLSEMFPDVMGLETLELLDLVGDPDYFVPGHNPSTGMIENHYRVYCGRTYADPILGNTVGDIIVTSRTGRVVFVAYQPSTPES